MKTHTVSKWLMIGSSGELLLVTGLHKNGECLEGLTV